MLLKFSSVLSFFKYYDCKRRTEVLVFLFVFFRGHVAFEGSYFFFCIQLFGERLSEKMCTRQSRKVIWHMIDTLFLTTVAVVYFFCFPLALANTFSWPFVPILSNFSEEQWTQKPPTMPFGIVVCTFSDNFSRNSCMWQSISALPPLSRLRLVWLKFCLPFSRPFSRDFLAFSLSRAKEVSYASSRICSSVQNKEEPPAHFEKRLCLFVALQKVIMVLKTPKITLYKNFFAVVALEFDDSCYLRRCETISLSLVFNSQFHAKYLASLTNQNGRFYSIMRF